MDARGTIARWGRAAVALAVGVAGLTAAGTAPAQAAGPVVVSLSFDDGLTAQHDAAAVLAPHGVRATYYVNSGAIDQRGGGGTMTWAQAQALAAAGHEIGGHTRDHVDITRTDLTTEDRWQQLCGDRVRLDEKGFPAHSFAYASGNFDEAAIAMLEGCGYQSARKAGGLQFGSPTAADTRPPVEGAYRIRALGAVDSGPLTSEGLQEAVETAYEDGGGWLPILFHRVCYSSLPSYAECMGSFRPIDSSSLSAFAAWLAAPEQAARGITTATMTEAFNNGRSVPTVRTTAPADGSVAPNPPTLSGTTSLPGNVRVKVFSGDYSTGTPALTIEGTAAGGTWSVDTPSALAPGRYTALASVSTGGATGTSVPVRFDVGTPGDTTAPTVRITTPTNGAILNVPAPPIGGTAGQAPGDEPNVTVSVQGTTAAGAAVSLTRTASVNPGGAWSTAPTLADGTYTARATQRDRTGNVGASTPVSFTVDTTAPVDGTAPTVTVSAPANGSRATIAKPRISGTGGNAATDLKTVEVTVHEGSSASGPAVQTLTAPVAANGSWAATPAADLVNGSYTVLATQRDQAGNTGTSSPVTFTVAVAPPPDTTAPKVAITQPAAGSTVSQNPVIKGTGGTAAGDVRTISVALFAGATATGDAVQQLNAPVTTSGSWSVAAAALEAGTYTARASQTDDAGNTGTITVTFKVAAPPVTPMTVSRVSRTSLPQGATGLIVVAKGTGLPRGAKAAVSGKGVTVRSTKHVNPTTLILRLDVAQGAGLGLRSLVVGAAGRDDAVCARCFRVTRGPGVRRMSSRSVGQGAHKAVVRLVGSFGPGARVGVSGKGVRTRVLGGNRSVLRVGFWTWPAAPLGARTLTVTNNDGGRFTCARCLTVVKAPKAHRVLRGTARRGRYSWVVAQGAAFSRSTVVTVTGPGVRVTAVRTIGPRRLRVRVYVAPGARRTARNLVLVDRATGGRSVLRKALRIL